jgi:hypothetical protein
LSILGKFLFSLLVCVLAGCATSEKIVSSNTVPSSSVGYVGGNFTVGKPTFTSAFVLVNQATSVEYVLSFSTIAGVEAGHQETSLIALPPGTYRATHWIVYNSYWGPSSGGREGKKEISSGPLTKSFTVKSNEVVFLGKFYAEYGSASSFIGFQGRWRVDSVSDRQARDYLKSTYPNFSAVNFTCIACSP